MKIFNKEKLNSLLSSDKSRVILIVIGLLAILLIFLSGRFSDNQNKKETENQLTATSYSEKLTSDIALMIEDITGAGKAKVLLTLESSYEYVYLDDDKTLTKILEPRIRGVAVVCAGGDDPVIKEKVTQMLSTVLSVSTSCISVSKLI